MVIKLKFTSTKLDSEDELIRLVKDITKYLENAKGRNKDSKAIDELEKSFSNAYRYKNIVLLRGLLSAVKKL